MALLERITSDGFGIIPEVLAQDETVALVEVLERSDLPRSRAGIRHGMRHAAVAALARDQRLLGIAQRILGSGAFPYRATLFGKSPAANWLVVWHQDTALPLQGKRETLGWGPWSVKDDVTYAHAPAAALTRVLALCLHLDDSTADNGPLRVLPGTHTLGVLTESTFDRNSAQRLPGSSGRYSGHASSDRSRLIQVSV